MSLWTGFPLPCLPEGSWTSDHPGRRRSDRLLVSHSATGKIESTCWFCRSRWRCEYFSQGHVQLFSLVVPIPPHFFFQTSHASRMFAFLIRQPSTARLIWFAYGAAHRNICLVPWCWVHRSVKRNPSTTGSAFSLMMFLKRLGRQNGNVAVVVGGGCDC